MRNRQNTLVILLLAVVMLMVLLSGCGNKNNSLDTPIDITVDYLSGEYSDQLIRDGAEITLGTVSLTADENGNYTVTTNAMVIVESDMTDAGYYIADKNISTTAALDSEAGIIYFNEESGEPEIISAEELAAIVNDSDYDPLEEGNEELFEVYSIGGNIQLIMEKELPVSDE